jgi:hypothetical protein
MKELSTTFRITDHFSACMYVFVCMLPIFLFFSLFLEDEFNVSTVQLLEI